MLRAESETGWWLVTHPDHAHLAAAFAAHWGNSIFIAPEPRSNVLRAIRGHDDGWAARDTHPRITREGKPAAFSHELVGKYSAFEEINLADYLAVRENALAKMEAECSYAALLISMHTYNLLSAHADRSTIATDQLPLLDAFLDRQLAKQQKLRSSLRANQLFTSVEVEEAWIQNQFRLLQAMDNLSLYSCIGYMHDGDLLHALPTSNGETKTVEVMPTGLRQFRLKPYPFDETQLTFTVPARHVEGKTFDSAEELENKFTAAAVHRLTITLSA